MVIAHIENLCVYPVKGLDRMAVDSVTINDAGTFRGDREYAMLDPEEDSVIEDRFDSVGKTFNGKEIDHTHEVKSTFDPSSQELKLTKRESGEEVTFDLQTERDAASDWLSEFVGSPSSCGTTIRHRLSIDRNSDPHTVYCNSLPVVRRDGPMNHR